jgi:hypothetical protein
LQSLTLWLPPGVSLLTHWLLCADLVRGARGESLLPRQKDGLLNTSLFRFKFYTRENVSSKFYTRENLSSKFYTRENVCRWSGRYMIHLHAPAHTHRHTRTRFCFRFCTRQKVSSEDGEIHGIRTRARTHTDKRTHACTHTHRQTYACMHARTHTLRHDSGE